MLVLGGVKIKRKYEKIIGLTRIEKGTTFGARKVTKVTWTYKRKHHVVAQGLFTFWKIKGESFTRIARQREAHEYG